MLRCAARARSDHAGPVHDASRVGARRASAVWACFGLFWSSAALSEVVVVGVGEAIRTNVLAYLELDELDCNVDERRLGRLYQAAPAQILTALEAYGYYAADVTPSLELDDDCWNARFEIAAGDPVRLRSLDIAVLGEAETDATFQAAVRRSGLAVGQPLRHGAYEALKRTLTGLARERGYAQGRFVASRIDVYPDELAADVELRYDSGPRYSFGEVEIEQDVLSELFLRQYLEFDAGDPYSNRQLTALYAVLSDSGYFETVDIRPLPPDRASQTIAVSVRLTPAPRRVISYGIGFSSDTGPRLRFGRTNRRWNDRGHQFGTQAMLSPVISEFSANYRFPYGDPRYEWVSFDAGTRRESTDTSESESFEIGARRVLERPGGWTRSQTINAAVEDFEVGEQTGRSRLLMPGIQWTRTRADDTLRPSRGSRLSLELRGAGDAFGSDTSFFQAIGGAKLIRSIGGRGRVLVRGDIGVIWEDVFEDLPPSVRFFTGGDHTVRGYGFKTLGPVDGEGEVIGGNRLVTASFEYEHRVRSRWSVAFFVDSGNAFRGSEFDAKTGAGLGVRWQSPLGQIRFDIAAPLDDPDRSARIHINLGPDL